MWRDTTANLADLLFSVSEAMDISDFSLADHQMRTAYISARMAARARMDYPALERLFVAALLHDIGALSPEEKVSAHIFEDLMPGLHCQRGAQLFRDAFWLAPSAQLIEWHHTTWEDHSFHGHTLAETDVLGAQILFLADHLERFLRRDLFILHQVDSLIRRVHGLSGKQVHPEVVALFDEVAVGEDFWLEMVSPHLGEDLRNSHLLRPVPLNDETVQSIAGVFKDMTDFRSQYTATHSAGVAACARAIGGAMAFSGREQHQLFLAGLLHDMGKLVVPNAILYKPGALTTEEYEVVRQHPFYTLRTLGRVRGFEQIAEWAGMHHERINGSGYGRHLQDAEMDSGAKVVAVADVATALAEERPYRPGWESQRVLSELRTQAERELLDKRAVQALADNYGQIMQQTAEAQSADERRYQERYANAGTQGR